MMMMILFMDESGHPSQKITEGKRAHILYTITLSISIQGYFRKALTYDGKEIDKHHIV